MKKISIILLLIIMCAGVHAAVRPNIMVSDFNIAGEAKVGNDFNLSVTLYNAEVDTCAKNVILSVKAGFPFVMKGITSIPVGDICRTETKNVAVPLNIDPTATGGFYQLTVVNDYESVTLSQFSSSSTLNLHVDGSPDITADIANSEPVDIYPGDTATVTIQLQNKGTFQAESVHASMQIEPPIDVKWSQSTEAVGLLDAKQIKTVDFTFEVPKDAESKDYPMDLQVNYLDEDLIEKVRQFKFDLHVKDKAEFETTDNNSDQFYSDQNSRQLKIMIENTGTDTARKVKAKLLPSFPFSTDGSVKYIDILEPGDSAPLEFTINIDKDGTPGPYALDLLVDYEDAQGKSLQDTTEVGVTILQKSMVRSIFMDYWFLWVLLIIALIIIVRKKTRKKKRKK